MRGVEKWRRGEEEKLPLTDEGEVALQELPVRVEPRLRQAAVLVLADDVVHDVGQQARHHQDLHVVALPAVLQVGWNLETATERTTNTLMIMSTGPRVSQSQVRTGVAEFKVCVSVCVSRRYTR